MSNNSPSGLPHYHCDAHYVANGSIKLSQASHREASVGKLQSHTLGTGELPTGTPPGPLTLRG